MPRFCAIAAVGWLLTVPAAASTYQMQFSASGFVDFNGIGGAPTDPVNGSFVYQADSPGGPITAFNSVSLNIAGYSYAPAEVGYQYAGANTGLIGGALHGVDTIWGGTTDFFLQYRADTLTAIALYYSPGTDLVWSARQFSDFHVNELQTPLPGALVLFASGLGLLGVLRWKR